MISLASAYRPKTWDEVLGQDSVIKVLRKQIENSSIKNSYLFCGATGSGKTTVARLLANELNNGVGTPIEIDAASNNGVENMRSIVQEAQERSVGGTYKVFILDEVQVLNTATWQILLKTLEEPPEYTIFILCTTDPQKVPATIMNRVQRFNFNRVSTELICNRLKYICEREGFTGYEESIAYISNASNGCVREALTLLDKVTTYSTELSIENTLEILGEYSYDKFFSLINSMIDGDEKGTLEVIDGIYSSSGDLPLFVDKFLRFCLDVTKYALFQTYSVTNIPAHMEDKVKNVVNFENPVNYYNYVTDRLLDLKNMLKSDTDILSTVEVMCLRICRMQ